MLLYLFLVSGDVLQAARIELIYQLNITLVLANQLTKEQVPKRGRAMWALQTLLLASLLGPAALGKLFDVFRILQCILSCRILPQ